MKANIDTVESVPYLTHLDFARAVRELTEFVDYTVLNLAEETHSSGIIQYYKKGPSLDKLLKATHTARVNELGKVAALQYERFVSQELQQEEDFSTSVKRYYIRQSMLSTLKPMLLFV